jgi:5-methylcytosine-specific restriction endonuclease McrA
VTNDANPTVPPGSAAAPRAKLAPLSPERYALQVTLSRTAHDLLREAQALLGHTLPSGDIAQVLERALSEMVERLRKSKYGETARPRVQVGVAQGRHIPAAIRHAVVARDGARCTFFSAKGKRCEERMRLEFDHVKPIGVGGQTSVENLRLRCRAHNQYAAEYAYGAEFMGAKRGRASPSVAGARPNPA